MFIKKLKLKNYRNYKEIEIELSDKINIFYGNNAEGKTNLLESIFLCSTSKSHKNSKENEIINFNEKDAHIKLFFCKKNEEKIEVIDIQLNKDSKKGIAVNGLKIDKLKDFLGFFTTVIFSPEDLNIIKEGPQVRRKFIDIELCQIDKIYLSYLNKYNKILNERNILLKDIKETFGQNKNDLINLLETYDDELIKNGIEVIKRRKKNVEEINEEIKNLYFNISSEKEKLNIEYENDILREPLKRSILKNLFFKNATNLGVPAGTITRKSQNTDFFEVPLSKSEQEVINESQIKEEYKKNLLNTREQDIKQGFTTIGPHRDDIGLKINDNDLRKYGSQGQKKTVAICLKLAELKLIKEKINDTPVLLLDDVFSELDEDRQKLLIENIKDIQTIITCTGMKKNIFELLNPNKIFKVQNNAIEERNGK